MGKPKDMMSSSWVNWYWWIQTTETDIPPQMPSGTVYPGGDMWMAPNTRTWRYMTRRPTLTGMVALVGTTSNYKRVPLSCHPRDYSEYRVFRPM